MRHVKDGCVCEICGYYGEFGSSCRCMVDNDNFNNVRYPEECDDFEYCDDGDDDDYDDYDDDFDPTEVIECPCCGADAYWEGAEYECSDCGWCGK